MKNGRIGKGRKGLDWKKQERERERERKRERERDRDRERESLCVFVYPVYLNACKFTQRVCS